MDNQITYDSYELIQLLERSLDKLAPYRYDSKFTSLLGKEFTDKIKSWDNLIRKQKDLPLTVVVCGEFKRGKSSLINALLGEEVVTTNVTTETVTTNRISYGAHQNEIVLSGGRRMRLSDEELKSQNLKKILASLPEKATSLEIKRPLEILKQVTIIDTPGLGDAMKDFSQDVETALRQADAVIYVFSVMSPLSVQEQLFIKNVIKPQKYTELYLIGNAADVLDDESVCENMNEMLSERLKDILPSEEPILLSALDERCRQLGTERPNEELQDYLSSSFNEFRAEIEYLLQEKKECIIPDRIQRLLMGMTDDLSTDLNAMREGLKMEFEEISARIDDMSNKKETLIGEQEQVMAQIDQIFMEYRADAVDRIEEFISKMQSDIDNISKESTDDVKKYYSLFCIDTIQAALQYCTDVYVTALYDKVNEISEKLSKNLALSGDVASVGFNFALQNKTWTSGDNVAFIGEYAGSIASQVIGSSLISIIPDYIGGVMREKQINDSLPDVIESIKVKYPKVKKGAIDTVCKTFAKLTDEVKKEISIYFDSELEDFKTRFEQSVMVARQDDEQKQIIQTAIEEIESVLNSIKGEFDFFNTNTLEVIS